MDSKMKQHLDEILKDNITKFTTLETQRDLEEKVNREKALKNDYHGRELLELLQNVDDAYQELCEKDSLLKGRKVTAFIEYKDNVLTIANTGTEFTKDTIERLCQGSVSSKKINYIGSKGIGFRSVLNWAKEIYIYSGRYALRFSEQYAGRQLESIKDNKIVKRQLTDAKNNGEELYFPMLCAPEAVEPIEKDCDTVIKIIVNPENINDDYNVTNQINELDYYILLFLPNITDIEIKTDNDSKHYSKESSYKDGIKIIGITSLVNGGMVSQKEEFYFFDNNGNAPKIKRGTNVPEEIKLAAAIPKDITNKSFNVYSFFPIIGVQSPFRSLLHATFLLNQNRNALVTDKEQINERVLKELLCFYVNTVCNNFKNMECTFDAVSLLLPLNFSDDSNWRFTAGFREFSLEEYYLNILIDKKILPTVNGDYISVKDEPKLLLFEYPSVFCGEGFGSLIKPLAPEENCFIKKLSKINDDSYNLEYTAEELCSLINRISAGWKLEQQIEVFVWWNDMFHHSDFLPDLIKNNKNEFLKKGQTCFLSGNVAVLPDWTWAKITIISKRYQDALINYYEQKRPEEIERLNLDKAEKKISKSRALTNLVKSSLVTLREQSTDDLISPVNESIEDDYERAVAFVKWLWKEHRATVFKQEALSINYKFPDANKQVKPSKFLYFDKKYGNDLGETLMSHTDMSIFEAPDAFEIALDDSDEFRRFINKLGVLELPKIEKTPAPDESYKNMLKCNLEGFRYFVRFSVDYIKNIDEILKNITMETIIAWITRDQNIYNAVLSGVESAGSFIEYKKSGKRYNDYLGANISSYLLFIFSTSKWIKISGDVFAPNECLFTDDKKLLNVFPCVTTNMVKELSRNTKTTNNDSVKRILRNLGVKEKIYEFDSDMFYSCLLRLSDPSVDKDGYISRMIYRQCIDADTDFNFAESPNKAKFFSEGKVFAKNKNEQGFYPVNEVFFSSSAVLNMANRMMIFTPQKSGSVKKMKDLFNVDALNEKYSLINESIVTHRLDAEFQVKFNEFLRYAFCYRVENESGDDIRRFKDIKVTLVSAVKILIDDGQMEIFESYSAIRKSNYQWYIYVSKDIFKPDDFKISVSIEDIFNVMLNYPGKLLLDKFSELYRSGENYKKMLLKKDFGTLDILDKADRILHNSETIKENFIRAILKNQNYNDESKKIIDNNLDFSDFDSIKNKKYLVLLLRSLKWEVSDLIDHGYDRDIAIVDYNEKTMGDCVKKYKKKYRSSLYLKLKDSDISAKKSFLDKYYRFVNFNFDSPELQSVNFDPLAAVKNHFAELNTEVEVINLDEIYSNNRRAFLNAKESGFIDILDRHEHDSLLYFGEFDYLNTVYEKYINDKSDSGKPPLIDTSKNVKDLVIPRVLDAPVPKKSIDDAERRKVSGKTYSIGKEQISNEKKQMQGDEAEHIVVTALRGRKIGKVCDYFNSAEYSTKWVSGAAKRIEHLPGDDTLRYDIELSADNQPTLYIEVKSSEKGECVFQLSDGEYSFACDNADNYMVIFVGSMNSESQIYIAPLEPGFWESEHYEVTPNNYTVTCIRSDVTCLR